MKNFKRGINEISDCERKNEPITYRNGQHHVLNSILCNFTSRAIYFNSSRSNNRLFIGCCSFSYDTSNSHGGAVNFERTGEIVFSRVNGIYCNCYDYSSGHFTATITKNSKSSLNYSSLSSCSNKKRGSYASYFISGCHEISDTNISDCKAYNSGFIYRDSSSKSFAQLSNFYNQTADGFLYLYQSSEFDLKTIKCNYIRNSGDPLIFFLSNAHLFVENCNILNNKANNLFYAQSGKMIVISCCLFNSSYRDLTLGLERYSFDLSRMNDSSCPQEFLFEPVSPVLSPCKMEIKSKITEKYQNQYKLKIYSI